jgi:hypothetical protein
MIWTKLGWWRWTYYECVLISGAVVQIRSDGYRWYRRYVSLFNTRKGAWRFLCLADNSIQGELFAKEKALT